MVDRPGPADYLRLIQDLESQFGADDWMLFGVHVWPIIRTSLGHGSFSLTASSHAGSEGPARRDARTGLKLGNAMRALGATLTDPRHHRTLRRDRDVVFLGDGVSRVRLNGRFYDRLCEPFMETLDALGLDSLLLEPRALYLRPRNRPSHFIQPAIDRRRLMARLRTRRYPTAPDRFTDFLAQVDRSGFARTIVSWPVLVKEAAFVRTMAGYFARVLKRVHPRHAFVVDLNLVSMAFNLACREVGIRSTEIQHGMQGKDHWAYSGWHAVPAGGYPELPSGYWVWSENEHSVIEAWAAPTDGAHRALVGGNLWMRKWSDPDDGLVTGYRRLARDRAGGERCVLWTMQWGLAHEFAVVLDAIRKAPSGWTWWCRLHPLMTEIDRQAALRALNSAGISEDEVRWATTMPLPALIGEVDVHLTHSSATVLEAAEWAVPSIVTSAEFAAYLPNDVRAAVQVAVSPTEILAAIERVRPRGVPIDPSTNLRPDETLRALLSLDE